MRYLLSPVPIGYDIDRLGLRFIGGWVIRDRAALPDAQKYTVRKPVFMRVCGVEQMFDHFLTTKKPVSVGFNRE